MAGIFHEPLELVVIDGDREVVGRIRAVIVDKRYDPNHLRDQLLIRLDGDSDIAHAAMTVTAQADQIRRLEDEVHRLKVAKADLITIIRGGGQSMIASADLF